MLIWSPLKYTRAVGNNLTKMTTEELNYGNYKYQDKEDKILSIIKGLKYYDAENILNKLLRDIKTKAIIG